MRSLLHNMGRRFRVARKDLPGSPDIANVRGRWAIFVHGCFWHQHAGCRRATLPKRNRAFWQDKFEANRARDTEAECALRSMGFRVIVVWECEIDDVPALRERLIAEVPSSVGAER